MTTPVPAPFTYSGDPKSSIRDEVRFLAQDTDSTRPMLSDLEMDYIIDKWIDLYESPTYCAAVAAASISRKFARLVTISDDGTTVQLNELQQRYADVAEQLRQEYEAEGAVGGLVNLDNILLGLDTFDPSIEPLQFQMGLDDNPRAGGQNWGGELSGYGADTADVANDGLVSWP